MSAVIRYASLAPARWANGGGVTRQVAAGSVRTLSLEPTPPGGGAGPSEARDVSGGGPGGGAVPDWDWRISIAEVATAGPFSPLPGIDRIITIIDGDLIALTVDGTEQAVERFRPFRFSGDAATSAGLPTGPLMDLNLMTRRGVCQGYAAIVELSKKRPQPVRAGQFAVLLQGEGIVSRQEAGPASAGGSPGTDQLGRFDTVAGSTGPGPAGPGPAGPGPAGPPEISGRGFLAVLTIDAVS